MRAGASNLDPLSPKNEKPGLKDEAGTLENKTRILKNENPSFENETGGATVKV
jgi:hypothetical protein